MQISGKIVDIFSETVYPATITVNNARIVSIKREHVPFNRYIVPGLIDSHIHIESSMLIPSEFARLAVVCGTVATVSDPHEIANVCGVEGVRFMIENGDSVPFKFYFGAPSCVPATPFETAGSSLGINEIRELLMSDNIKYLSEMMNFPGVINDSPDVIAILNLAKSYGKPIDGHAPGLRGESCKKYIDAGISTDHECVTIEEALEKLSYGMKIHIREGSAARNFDELVPLIRTHPDTVMLCSDDKHPDDLVKSHINDMVKRAIKHGIDIMRILRATSLNPVKHYGLDVGLLREGDYADFIVVDNLTEFNVLETYINGNLVAKDGKTLIKSVQAKPLNNFSTQVKSKKDFAIEAKSGTIKAIVVEDGQITTKMELVTPKIEGLYAISDTSRDLLKIAVVNRYENAAPAVGFIKNFGLKTGAIASSIAHDSHNIIAIGVRDSDICRAVNLVLESRGGIAAVCGGKEDIMPLPFGGIMTNANGYETAKRYSYISSIVKEKMGSPLRSPFMLLSFMALIVIPSLKISDKGLFDVDNFTFTELCVLPQ
ncbi:MAG: adenine deaminase [Nitrospirae bacterium]|nr:adenine deaminase [Nitrospirota bacterium]MBF0521155.1 adenine deaminase [Nitrospirota bacterium]MBF0535180.1 adenine deaminase [Nitrospirota bacterium]MBF0615201.1 adenine deaminase [Nitrospirota bacterium]